MMRSARAIESLAKCILEDTSETEVESARLAIYEALIGIGADGTTGVMAMMKATFEAVRDDSDPESLFEAFIALQRASFREDMRTCLGQPKWDFTPWSE